MWREKTFKMEIFFFHSAKQLVCIVYCGFRHEKPMRKKEEENKKLLQCQTV